ncbi:hypothetical protein BJ742DRAFT_769190 [Cladochytrium replicatum]|nr:hypothetical protein BJ742DRAFT_769190 [Cladochytrium replicatum]
MAEASGKKGKGGKQKAQKMSLGSFLTNDDLGSWADDVAGLPTAPATAASDVYADREPSRPLNHRESVGGGDRGYGRDRDRDSYSGGGGGGGRERDGYPRMGRDYGGDRGDRGGRESTMERRGLPVPSRPPYIAHLGNLAYDLRESDVNNFFRDLRIVSVRLVRGSDDRPKGFGYVEFSDSESLEAALRLANENLAGRSVRIDVAEPPKESHRGGSEGEEKFSGDWRQRADVPRFASPTRSDSGNSMGDLRGGRENGSRYSTGPERRSGYGFGGDRDRERDYGGDRYGGDRYGRDSGRDSPSASDWGNKRLSYQTDGGAQRRKLELLPRTVEAPAPRAASGDRELRSPTTSTAGSEKSTEPAKKKADPFGGAKPRDEAEIQRKIEERRKEREEEKRKQEEAEKEKKRQEEEERRQREEGERLERMKREEEAAAAAKQKREAEAAAAEKAKLEEEAVAEKRRQEAEQQQLERERKEAELKRSWRRSAPVGAAAAAGVERSDSRGERGGGRGGRGRGNDRNDGVSAWRDGSGRGRGLGGPGGRGRGGDRRSGPPRDPPSMPVAKDERVDIKTKNTFEMLREEVDE